MNKPFQFISHLFDSVFFSFLEIYIRFQNLNGLIITEREQSVFFSGARDIIFSFFFNFSLFFCF